MDEQGTGTSAGSADADIEITSTPGIADHAAAGTPPSPRAVSEFRDSAGVLGTVVGQEFDLVREQAITAEGNPWQWLVGWFSPTRHVVTGYQDVLIEIQSYWLTLPNCAGASVKLTVSHSQATATSASCTILGIGGGPTFTMTAKVTPEYTATENRRAIRSVIGHFQRIEVRKHNRVLGEYPRLVGLDRSGNGWTYPVSQPPAIDQAWQLKDDDSYDWRDASTPNTVTVGIDRDTTWELDATLKLSQLNLEAGVSRKVTYLESTTLEYTLPPGQDYAWRRYRNLPVFYWTP
jgi:hypothetical protein